MLPPNTHTNTNTLRDDDQPRRWVTARYRVRSTLTPEAAAERLACEQSARGFAQEWGVSPEAVATVASISSRPHRLNELHDATISIAYPHELAGSRPSQLLNVIAGETHHLDGVDRVFLEDFDLPGDTSWLVQGDCLRTRAVLGVYDRPLFCAPIVPPVGLDDGKISGMAQAAWSGGIDIVKDDELRWIEDESRALDHVTRMLNAREAARSSTGERKAFVTNLIAGGHALYERLDAYARAGVDGVLMSPLLSGFDTLVDIRREYDGLIFVHNTLASTMYRTEEHGIGLPALAKLARLCGADVVVFPSPWGPFYANEEMTAAAARACVPTAMPGMTGWKSVCTLADTAHLTGSVDFCFLAGTAVFEHPAGPSAGACALREAWRLITTNGSLTVKGKERMSDALRQAIAWSRAHGRVGPLTEQALSKLSP